jgi:hypothetical protein
MYNVEIPSKCRGINYSVEFDFTKLAQDATIPLVGFGNNVPYGIVITGKRTADGTVYFSLYNYSSQGLGRAVETNVAAISPDSGKVALRVYLFTDILGNTIMYLVGTYMRYSYGGDYYYTVVFNLNKTFLDLATLDIDDSLKTMKCSNVKYIIYAGSGIMASISNVQLINFNG